MIKAPVFHKENAKVQVENFLKNIWCPFYDICLEQAAKSDTLLDCSECDNSTINFKDDWENRFSLDMLS